MTKKTKKVKVTELKEGDLIRHTTQDWGNGRIMQVANGVVKIAFANGDKKSFPASSRYLELIPPTPSEAPPTDDHDSFDDDPS